MNVPATSLTMGGLFVGLAIPVWHLTRFSLARLKNYKNILRDSTELIPITAGMAYGGLATATTSGLIGAFTGAVTFLGNGAGSFAMWGLTGGTTTLNTRSNPLELDGPGNLILLLITVVVLAGWKVIPSDARPRMRVGIISGVLLGLSATLGGVVAATIIPAVNSAGATLVGSIN